MYCKWILFVFCNQALQITSKKIEDYRSDLYPTFLKHSNRKAILLYWLNVLALIPADQILGPFYYTYTSQLGPAVCISVHDITK